LKKWQLLELFAYFLSGFFDGFSKSNRGEGQGFVNNSECATLPSSFTVLLQRCDGFKPAISFAKL
jgi:hypothetical protein